MEKIRWAPKIQQAKIWQLYQNDALGAVDENLVKDVAFRLFHRCRSIFLITRRELECPRCGAIFSLYEADSWKALPGTQSCPTPDCGWESSAAEWHQTWENRDLLGTAAIQAVETYLNDYPQAKTSEKVMVCIDQLIHAFHISLRTGKVNRSFANNLIEGSHEQVVEFLDKLSAIPGGADKDKWRAEVDAMFARRQGRKE